MICRQKPSPELIKKAHGILAEGAVVASQEAIDFGKKDDQESQALSGYYAKLATLVTTYLLAAKSTYNVKLVDQFQTAAQALLVEAGLDKLATRIEKTAALHVTKIAIG